MAESGKPTPEQPLDAPVLDSSQFEALVEKARQDVKPVVKEQRAGERLSNELAALRLKDKG